jgi:hypothetical protein
MPATMIAAATLGVASGWRARVVRADVHHIVRAQAGARAYRPELGWTSASLLAQRTRWATAGLVSAAAVAVSLAAPATAVVAWPAAGLVTVAWLARDARLHHGRYTSVCIATLGACVSLAAVSAPAAGLLASVAAAQLYLVAGIRKLDAPAFMSGRVLLDTAAYAVCQAAAGNREFLTIAGPARVATALDRGTLVRACRAASVATVAFELAIGLGAAGLLPVAVTFGLAVPMHAAFMLLGPKRLLSFTAASLGLLALATVNPVLGV